MFSLLFLNLDLYFYSQQEHQSAYQAFFYNRRSSPKGEIRNPLNKKINLWWTRIRVHVSKEGNFKYMKCRDVIWNNTEANPKITQASRKIKTPWSKEGLTFTNDGIIFCAPRQLINDRSTLSRWFQKEKTWIKAFIY